jgi:hypothetical protein
MLLWPGYHRVSTPQKNWLSFVRNQNLFCLTDTDMLDTNERS